MAEQEEALHPGALHLQSWTSVAGLTLLRLATALEIRVAVTLLITIGALVGIVGAFLVYVRKYQRWSATRSKAVDPNVRPSQ